MPQKITIAAEGFALAAAELSEPRADEVLVRLVAAGVCHTDLFFAPLAGEVVLGHEGAGMVEAIGADVTAVQPGDHVVLSYAWCGACPQCTAGRMAYCESFQALNLSGLRGDGSTAMSRDGRPIGGNFFGQSSFATHSVTSERNVVRVPGDLPLEHLAPFGCGVQTGAGAVLNVLAPPPGSSIAVFGCGGVGLSAVMAAKIAKCERIIAVEPDPARRELALELGATEAVTAPDRFGVDFSVECVGLPEAVRGAVDCLRSPGRCVTLGLQGPANPIELDQTPLLYGRSLQGCIEGEAIPQRFIPELVEHYRAGRLPVDRLVRTYAFDQIGRGVSEGAVKPVLVF